MARKRVLIVCSGNSARSQIAEGLLRHEAGDEFEVFSAGTHPHAVREEAVSVMSEIGIDISGQTSKALSQFEEREFDLVITVCDRAREECPVFPGNPQRLHWPFDDPATFTSIGDARLQAYRLLRDRIHGRIMVFLGEGVFGASGPDGSA